MGPSPALERFRVAQSDPEVGYAAALAELRSTRKRGHWIWYVFPQLAGLGRSKMSRAYAIADADEAAAYLRDPVLGPRLLEITEIVATRLASGISLESLMGSEIDAQKLVSSMTLFERVASDLAGRLEEAAPAPRGPYGMVADRARQVLDEASRQGRPRCPYTLQGLEEERPKPGSRLPSGD